MASTGTIQVQVTPAIKEAIDYLAPIVKASVNYFECVHECGDDYGALVCADAFHRLETLTTQYIQWRAGDRRAAD